MDGKLPEGGLGEIIQVVQRRSSILMESIANSKRKDRLGTMIEYLYFHMLIAYVILYEGYYNEFLGCMFGSFYCCPQGRSSLVS